MKKEAMYYEKLEGKKVRCFLCPRKCVIKEGEIGNCKVRANIKGKLYSLVYGKPSSLSIDPIEKKPLYHFLPGSNAFSIGTAGCNLHCIYCQNYDISQLGVEEIPHYSFSPKEIVKKALEMKCRVIAYTYNEPTVFYEYMLDIAKIAKKNNLKNIIVSNGFINKEPLKKLLKYVDGVNIDLKSFDNEFYKKYSFSWINPVLESLKIIKKQGVWLEITNLIIPGLNDKAKKIKEMAKWIKDNLGKDVPLHFTAFYPSYKLLDVPPTPKETLFKARDIAKNYLDFVYIGNIINEAGNTYCPKCKALLIRRVGFNVLENNIKNGKCYKCGKKIPGVW